MIDSMEYSVRLPTGTPTRRPFAIASFIHSRPYTRRHSERERITDISSPHQIGDNRARGALAYIGPLLEIREMASASGNTILRESVYNGIYDQGRAAQREASLPHPPLDGYILVAIRYHTPRFEGFGMLGLRSGKVH